MTSNTLRMIALTAETSDRDQDQPAQPAPMRVLMASMRRLRPRRAVTGSPARRDRSVARRRAPRFIGPARMRPDEEPSHRADQTAPSIPSFPCPPGREAATREGGICPAGHSGARTKGPRTRNPAAGSVLSAGFRVRAQRSARPNDGAGDARGGPSPPSRSCGGTRRARCVRRSMTKSWPLGLRAIASSIAACEQRVVRRGRAAARAGRRRPPGRGTCRACRCR